MTQFEIALYSTILVLLIILAAFFSCAETALMAINRYRVRHQAKLKQHSALKILKLLKRPDRLLGAILIGNTFANMIASSLATLIAFHFWGDKGAILAAVTLTVTVLILAEIAPKTLAAMYPDKLARMVVYPVEWLLRLLHPAVVLANMIANSILRLFRIRVDAKAIEGLSREELRTLLYDTSHKISRQYQNMLMSILDLNKLVVDDAMIPSMEITGIDFEKPYGEIIARLLKISSHHGLVPVYRENVNHMIGVLDVRDFLKKILKQERVLDKDEMQQLFQAPYYIPQGTSLYTQLSYFQQSLQKLAFVVNEYGEIEGMLTLNDILQEIVGDFTQSLSVGKKIQKQTDDSYLVEGSMTVREFNRLTDWELPLGGPRTINGLIVEHLEALPRTGTALLIQGYPLEIIQVKDNRVKLVKIFPRLNQ